MSRLYRPTGPRVVTPEPQLPSADLLREVRHIERRRVLIDLRDAIDRIDTSEPDGIHGYGSRDRKARDFKKDVLAELRRMEASDD